MRLASGLTGSHNETLRGERVDAVNMLGFTYRDKNE